MFRRNNEELQKIKEKIIIQKKILEFHGYNTKMDPKRLARSIFNILLRKKS